MSLGDNAKHSELGSFAADLLIEAVYRVILLVTITGWTIVGFAVWVPLLIRTTTLLGAAVFYATLFRDRVRVLNAQASVHFAVRFYVRGFEHFLAFYRQRHEPEPPLGLLEPLSEMKWKELLIECFWVVGVWAALSFFLRGILVSISLLFG